MALYFNENLKYIRKLKNISQKELAEKIGVDQSTISYWEKGMDVTVENAIKVAEILKIPFDQFLGKDLRFENSIYNDETKPEPHTIYTDQETGLSVAFVSPDGRSWEELSKEEQEAYVSEAMDNLYEYKRNLKEKD